MVMNELPNQQSPNRKRRTNILAIWMNGELVGHWSRKAGVDELKYADKWTQSKLGRPLSLSLPFTPGNQKHRGKKVTYYFDNLLPDSRDIRERLARKFDSNSTSPFDLLVEIGRDCVGAIQLLPEGEEPGNIKQILMKPLSDAEIAAHLRSAVSANLIGNHEAEEELRISLAGAQEKTALLWYKDQWCEPHGATPTTHIFKLPMGLVGNMQADMQESVENEWLCSKIVAAFGIPVAYCDIGIFEDQKALIVERFDRKFSLDKSWVIRIPQEDFCQAKGLSSLQKYQSDGGLSVVDCMSLLERSVHAKDDKKTFIRAQILFWLLVATDGHAKNYSIRHLSQDAYELTPLYDILSIHPIIGNKNNQIAPQKAKMAMAIRGSKNYYHVFKIQRRHFVQQALAVGFSEEESNDMIDQILAQVDRVIEEVSAILPDNFPKTLAEKIFQGMISQAKKIAI
jgi:serine/threonine-protein kinase HipA